MCGGLFSEVTVPSGAGEKWIPTSFLSHEEIRVGRDAGKWSHPSAAGRNQQLGDLPYTLPSWLVVPTWGQCGEGPGAGLASLLEALRVPCRGGYFFLIQQAWMQRTSWVLVITWRSVRGRGCWTTTRTNEMVLPLSLSVPDFSH